MSQPMARGSALRAETSKARCSPYCGTSTVRRSSPVATCVARPAVLYGWLEIRSDRRSGYSTPANHFEKERIMNGEPGAAVLSIFAQLTDRIKQRIPVNQDGKPIGTMVYSHLVLGMPISKADYFRPWTPAGGASLQDKPPAPKPLPDGTVPAPAADDTFLKAMQAAWKTSLLCRTMLQVTKDESYLEYPTGKHL